MSNEYIPGAQGDCRTIKQWDGFIPGTVLCKSCGNELHGKDSSYPAETYLGTYNGLCYPCTLKGPFPTKDEISGAKIYSHPPSCPSWRRTREDYLYFEDCTKCRSGAIWARGHGAFADSYKKQCDDCLNKHLTFPEIAFQNLKQQVKSYVRMTFENVVNKKFNKLLKAKAIELGVEFVDDDTKKLMIEEFKKNQMPPIPTGLELYEFEKKQKWDKPDKWFITEYSSKKEAYLIFLNNNPKFKNLPE